MVVTTTATRTHLAPARVLAESVREHNPDWDVIVLVADGHEGDEQFEVITPADVGLDQAELELLAGIYAPLALTTAMKGRAMRHALDRGAETVVHLDADVRVYGDLSLLAADAAQHGSTLTPHSTTPWPPAGIDGAECQFLVSGAFNAGVLAASGEGRPFLDWWIERTDRWCVSVPSEGLHLDQAWLTLAPGLFGSSIHRDPGMNVMGWNLHDRDVEWEGDLPAIGGGPLRCFHFTAFDPDRPDRLGSEEVEAIWPSLANRPGAARLCRDYAERIRAARRPEDRAEPYRWGRLADGRPIDAAMREAYRRGVLAHEAGAAPAPPPLFAPGGAGQAVQWLGEGEPSRYVRAVRSMRPDVAAAFPAVPGPDEGRLLDWIDTQVAAGVLGGPEELMPSGRLSLESELPDGTEIDLAMRRAWRDGDSPPDPWDGDGFLRWLGEDGGDGVSRHLAALHAVRADLRAAFPAIPAQDLRRWAAHAPEARFP